MTGPGGLGFTPRTGPLRAPTTTAARPRPELQPTQGWQFGSGPSPAIWSGPVLVSTTTTAITAFSGTQVYQLPTVAVGDRLLLVASCGESTATWVPSTDMSAWTSIYASDLHAFHAWRAYTIYIADAAAVTAWSGATVTFNSPGGSKGSAQVLRIAGSHPGGIDIGWDVGAMSATGSNNAPDATDVLGWGAEQTLYVATYTAGSSITVLASGPADYINTSASTGTEITTGTAVRQAAIASDNPGPFSIDLFSNWQAIALSFRPTAATATRGPLVIRGLDRRRVGSTRLARPPAPPPAQATATPAPIVTGRRRGGRALAVIVQARNAAKAAPVATPGPIVPGVRPAARRWRSAVDLLRAPPSSASPEPLVVARRPSLARFRPSILLTRNPAAPVVAALATPEPIVAGRRPTAKARALALITRNPDRATPIATPEPLVVSRRPTRRPPAVVALRRNATTTRGPSPLTVTGRRARGQLGRVIVTRTPAAPATPATATPRPLVIGALLRRARRRRAPMTRGRGVAVAGVAGAAGVRVTMTRPSWPRARRPVTVSGLGPRVVVAFLRSATTAGGRRVGRRETTNGSGVAMGVARSGFLVMRASARALAVGRRPATIGSGVASAATTGAAGFRVSRIDGRNRARLGRRATTSGSGDAELGGARSRSTALRHRRAAGRTPGTIGPGVATGAAFAALRAWTMTARARPPRRRPVTIGAGVAVACAGGGAGGRANRVDPTRRRSNPRMTSGPLVAVAAVGRNDRAMACQLENRSMENGPGLSLAMAAWRTAVPVVISVPVDAEVLM